MSTARIVRKSFNGGEIAPELHYRSDLEAYHNACKSLKNMTVTPWGAATRRPPTELLAKIDTATYGVPVKYLPFRFSLSETFHVVFTDGSGSATPDAATADFIVFDADGVLQTLDGASTKILTTVYDPDDLLNLHFIQVNDFIYMTCGGDYPVQSISRFFDEDQSANRWSFAEFELLSGPFGDENQNRGNLLTIDFDRYSTLTTYAVGDAVVPIPIFAVVNGASFKFTRGNPAGYLVSLLQFSTNVAHGLDDNDIGKFVEIKDVVIASVGGSYQYFDGRTVTVGDNLSGIYSLVGVVDANTIRVDLSITSTAFVTVGFTLTGALVGEVNRTIYQSTQDGNLNKALTDTAWWNPVESYIGPMEAQTNFDTFVSTDVGRLIKVKSDAIKGRLKGKWISNQYSAPVSANGVITLVTEGGAWGGLLELQASTNGGEFWETIGEIRSVDGGSNGSIDREITELNTLIRVKLSEWAAPSANFDTEACIWRIELAESFEYFKIISVADARNATVFTLTPIVRAGTSYKWTFGDFSETTGFPYTLAIHDERMVFGGTKSKPNTVWASRVNDWGNFIKGDTEVSPYTFTIKSDTFDAIRWMRSTRNLMIGTDNSEVTMGSRDDSAVISPTNINVQTQTYFGSSRIQAVVTADLVFFVQGLQERVRSTQYDFGTDQYQSSEMSILAHHITKAGIKEMSFLRQPYSSIFFLLENGTAVSFTYERDNQVKGWARQEFGGGAFIVSAASNYSESGDIIAGIFKRGDDYALEKMGESGESTVYLDGQTQSASGWSTGKPLAYGSTSGLVVVMDDELLTEGTDYTWSGSTLTIPGHTDETVTVGWPFAFELQPTDIIELGDHGTKKRISKLSLYLLASGGCDVSINGEDNPFQAGDSLGAGERLTGEYELSVGGGTESAIQIKLSGNHHQPFNISAFGVHGQPSR